MTEFVQHKHGAWCHPAADGCPSDMPAPAMNSTEAARVAAFEAAPAAPESYVRQHVSEPTCWCGPQSVGTLGVWTHNMVEGQ